MLDRKKYFISIILFLSVFILFVPLHIDSTNKIINQQDEIDSVEGFFIQDNRNTRFRPRQYIQIDGPKEIQKIELEENIIGE